MSPRIVDREEKRLELIRAAAKMFAAQGLANTRMADIAEHAGVGKGTIYELDERAEVGLLSRNIKIAERA